MRQSILIPSAVFLFTALSIAACSEDSEGTSTDAAGAAGDAGGGKSAGGDTSQAGSDSPGEGGKGTAGQGVGGAGGAEVEIKVSLITKEEGNPFFAKMIEGAEAEAEAAGATLSAVTATTNEEQVTAIEAALADGAQGILIVAADTAEIVPTVLDAKKSALVIALDTPTDPEDATDALFATDNQAAGVLIGEYAKAALPAATLPKIVTLDGPVGLTVSDLRHAGFIEGFGIEDNDAAIVCKKPTMGSDTTGQAAMAACLAASTDVNIIYTVNEPVAAGAHAALVEANIDPADVIIVSVDGGCAGVQAVKDGLIAATAQQYPLKMASLGVAAVVDFVKTGTRVSGYTDTGVNLIADVEQAGVTAKDTVFGLANCWGTVQ